ncbi:MAG TPA: ImmA/IrrE family metallo-endopeptidase [Polyangiales bacterium]|nr:ImmA/IrrE family metallo-endopeptidase [Polyangiales bacterium]
MPRVDIPPKMLVWACERSGQGVEPFLERIPRLGDWLAEKAQPTLKQLEAFAKATRTPLGYLFLPEPPDERVPMPDFRAVAASLHAGPSPELLDTIHAMQQRQAWLHEALVEGGADVLPFVGSARLEDSPESIAAEMRRIVGLEDAWTDSVRSVRTWQEAVLELRRRIEKLGVMTIINGIVGNNTHRPLDVAEFRGFAIVDGHAPLIFVNGADARSAQMFTLAHELAHVWLGAEGLSGFEALFPLGTVVENWCNKVAAEFLVPAKEFHAHWREAKRTEHPFETLAREFKVSPIVAARRALDLRLIARDAFSSFYHEYTQRERQSKPRTGGGDFYNNQNTRVGALFAGHVIRAAMEGRIGFKEAYDLTDLHGGAFQEYAARLGVDV